MAGASPWRERHLGSVAEFTLVLRDTGNTDFYLNLTSFKTSARLFKFGDANQTRLPENQPGGRRLAASLQHIKFKSPEQEKLWVGRGVGAHTGCGPQEARGPWTGTRYIPGDFKVIEKLTALPAS